MSKKKEVQKKETDSQESAGESKTPNPAVTALVSAVRFFQERRWEKYSRAVWDAVSKGRFASLFMFFLFGLVIFVFLFCTVHSRPISQCEFPARYHDVIKVWIEHGFFKHMGMRFGQPVDQNPEEIILWLSYPMNFIQGAHLLQRISYFFWGEFSPLLMVLHNQGIVWISSALLGFLAFRLCLRLQLDPFHALLLGVSCQAVHQTFPYNLWYYWEIWQTTTMLIFAILYLIVLERTTQEASLKPWIHRLRAFAIFCIFSIEHIGGFLYIACSYLVMGVLNRTLIKKQKFLVTVLLPACAALGIFAAQRCIVQYWYPHLKTHASTFMKRTGFDGSTTYYLDHSDILHHNRDPYIGRWKYFFIGGVASILFLVAFSIKDPAIRPALFIVMTSLGLYVLWAFLFGQGVILHPWCADTYLVVTMALSLFAVFPAALERLTKYTGIFVLIFTVLAFCYCMVQLRQYALKCPITQLERGPKF